MINDELMISNYLDNKEEEIKYKPNAVDDAIEWSADAMRTIIIPTDDLGDLEDQWIKFNEMIKKNRRESDWKSIELFGMTNHQHYDLLKNKLVDQDINNEIESDIIPPVQADDVPLSESYIDASDSYYNADAINYTTIEVDRAREWAKESNRVIILPTRTLSELEDLWDSYNMMIKKHRRESDWMSQELFGITNLHHYEYLKNQFLREDISLKSEELYGSVIESTTLNDSKKYVKSVFEEESVLEASKMLLEMTVPHNNIYEELIVNSIISDALETFDSITSYCPTEEIPYGDMPYLDPDEMIDMGIFGQSSVDNYYGSLPDNIMINETTTVQEWFDNYYSTSKGFLTEFGSMSSDWVNKVRELTYGLKNIIESGNSQAIAARKQSILELGWDPDIEFNSKTRLLAREMAIERMTNKKHVTRVIDLREFRINDNDKFVLKEDINESILKPVFVVLTEGKSIISDSIRRITHDIYTHASIAFDSTLQTMYSYGVNEKSGLKGGFIEENIKDLPIGVKIKVFVFFVPNYIYNKIQELVSMFKKNVNKTAYGYKNLFTYLFNIPFNRDWKLICSQFVDRCLKAAGVDIIGKDSSLVSPHDINKIMTKENRIYSIYDDLASKYNSSKIGRLINSLSSRATPLRENNRVYNNETEYIMEVIHNIYNIPVLLEMKDHIDVVRNKNTRDILNNMLFDSITIRPYCEAKEFPIQFDKNGNLILKNLKKLDYEAEYAKSHKLLKEYKKMGNIEGIKYEISKLWMMNCMIEEKLNSKKFKDLPSIAVECHHKARAKILNDFQYYLKEVIKQEPDFNFTEYFDKSPFSSATTKINSSTMSFVSKLIKSFIKPF